ncbi:DUF29 domain-containing protein [Methylobacterium sp. J-048]|uniref:DUF29 domain-containing protein n=1 Tax=Methylobacterium sp. J-048 TaxID=2836635 RepID=UPI001FBAE71E|nr:DUF29 domain-containing protein [Methylobacterium sp. J-048]MCJ2060391.1 DUF29 domain-containing protein [Methylobacterium sp. J-048]
MAKAALKTPESDLYGTDLYLWSEQQSALLRAGRWSEIDELNVAEEIESLGGSQKSEIRSRLAVLILHLLKWEFQPEKRKYGWRTTIVEQRIRIDGLLDTSPSLRSWPDHVLQSAYRLAALGASSETRLPEKTFPKTCPYTVKQILDLAFYPGPPEEDVV